jgi:monooxygenase
VTTSDTDLALSAAPVDLPAHVDVLVVGAGLSGIGAACHLQTDAPGTSYVVLEARESSGGTWDLFRYPGVRSDSDMFTLGYAFRPWTRPEGIAAGSTILEYLRETARAYDVEQHIRYRCRVESASWSSADARWTVTVLRTDSGQRTTVTCGFLYLCSGYYRYDRGYTPDWPALEQFSGRVVHPQAWPQDLDVAGQRVVVIGSGATAVTLVPALVDAGAQVTMLQRSPSYVLSLPGDDAVAGLLRRVLPERQAYAAIRWKNVRVSSAIYGLSRRHPRRVRALLLKAVRKQLPPDFDVDRHFTPTYDPWDQRMCMVPEGDLFAAIRSGRADVVTDHVERFTATGLRLRSGAELTADVVVTATGLELLPLGGIALDLDGEPVVVPEHVAYKGMMLDGVPNLAFALGYTNASWTLKVDLVSAWVARLVRRMARDGTAVVTPRLPDAPLATSPFIEMSSGYFERARSTLPLQGDRAPWRLRSHPVKDAALFRGPDAHADLEFTRATADAVPRSDQ